MLLVLDSKGEKGHGEVASRGRKQRAHRQIVRNERCGDPGTSSSCLEVCIESVIMAT